MAVKESSGPWRGTRRAVVALLVVATLVVAGQWTLHRAYFRVQRVTISGLVQEPRAVVLARSGLATHPAMIDVNAGAIARSLELLPWVRTATVLLKWPHTVTITVIERRAVAEAADARGCVWLVDDTGQRLALTHSRLITATNRCVVRPAPSTYPLLVAQGLGPHAAWPFTSWARAAARVAGALPAAFQSQVLQVAVSRRDEVTLIMSTPVTFALGTPVALHAKFVSIASVLARPLLLHSGDVVDVSVPASPTVSGP